MERDRVGVQRVREGAVSIHALRMERDAAVLDVRQLAIVSIHALRMERDNQKPQSKGEGHGFNPRAPYGARRLFHDLLHYENKFQSTRSVWSATRVAVVGRLLRLVSIHALRMERDAGQGRRVRQPAMVSIHALRMERDPCPQPWQPGQVSFNPRAPYGARPHQQSATFTMPSFNPRAPYGARLSQRTAHLPRLAFQSTRSVWSATLQNA